MQAPKQRQRRANFFEGGICLSLLAAAVALEFAAFAQTPSAASPLPSSPSKKISSSSSSNISGQATTGPSGTPVLVELFTSEGCSSCPPADRLLARLAAEQPVRGALVVPLSLHVDYWDRLGWKDAFSSAALTERQAAYAARFGNAGRVYTPQMVVGGRVEFVGSDERAARRAIEAAAREPNAFVRVVPDGTGGIRVTVAGAGGPADVVLAVTEDPPASDVTRGENAGRKLSHVAVARELRILGTTDARGRFDGHVRLPAAAARGPLRLVAFAQDQASGRVLGVSAPFSL